MMIKRRVKHTQFTEVECCPTVSNKGKYGYLRHLLDCRKCPYHHGGEYMSGTQDPYIECSKLPHGMRIEKVGEVTKCETE